MLLHISIPIDAVPQGRPRFVNGITFDPPQSRQFKQDVRTLAMYQCRQVLTAPLKVSIYICRNLNKRESRRYGDIDNLVKGIMDALSGVAWKDDCQVVELHAFKLLATEPRITIDIEEVTDG